MFLRATHLTFGSHGGRGFLAALLLALGLAFALVTVPTTWTAQAQARTENAYPLTLVDDEGTEVVIEALPERIISLSPANTEIVFGLGAGDRLVGGTDFDDYPAEAADLTDVATFSGVVMERVVELDPDLVLAAGNFFTPPDDIARMRELGYAVVVVYAPDVPAVLADIELIGEAIGRSSEAIAITTRMASQLEAISEAATAGGERPRTFYQLGSEPEIFGPAPDSFVADMVTLAGGEPITTSDPVVFSIPLEELIVADPEVIVVGDANYGVCPGDVAGRSGWTGMTAVVNGDIRAVDDVPVTRPGPRLAQGLASLALAIDPGLELDLDALGLALDEPLCTDA
ncbi:MAG: ABC transporter substrate-binding protein [Chloroflexota bacterium]